jgi:hypothetical protein
MSAITAMFSGPLPVPRNTCAELAIFRPISAPFFEPHFIRHHVSLCFSIPALFGNRDDPGNFHHSTPFPPVSTPFDPSQPHAESIG